MRGLPGSRAMRLMTGMVIATMAWVLSVQSVFAQTSDTLRLLTPKTLVPQVGLPMTTSLTICTPGAWTPTSATGLAVREAGFLYDPRQDIIYSRMDPLQRHFGYAYGYDESILAMNTIIDCEPIFFDYAGKSWMIELWKGQYGLETGCEIGVYNRSASSSPFPYSVLDPAIGPRQGDSNASHGRYFDCVSNDERLVMSSTLYRKGVKLFCRGPETHWWLTGFKWGVFSDRTDLTMDVSITCLDATMKTAFVSALQHLGYTDVQTSGNQVSFKFDRPKTHQPVDDMPSAAVSAARASEQQIVAKYNDLHLASNDPNTVNDQGAAVIGNSFAIYSQAFYLSVIASHAQVAGISVSSVLRLLTETFDVTLDTASQFVSNAGYALESWFSGLQGAIDNVLDFSCVVEIANRGPYELVRESYGAVKGNYAIVPPKRIPSGGTGRFWLRDPKPSLDGSAGSAKYSWTDTNGTKHSSTFSFADPTGLSSNAASSSSSQFSLYTKSGSASGAYGSRNVVKTGGHPFFVAFVWGTGAAP